MISRQRLYPLLKRAAMTIFQWNTLVVRSSDGTGDKRAVMVGSPFDKDWGDCIALSIPLGNAVWQEVVILSPARARILAQHLIDCAERREKLEDCKFIDNTEPANTAAE